MTRRLVRLARCYRCLHQWHMRRRKPAYCPRCKSRYYDVPLIRPLLLGNGAGIEELVTPHRMKILDTARRHGVEGLWVFGSVRRREARRTSDIDLLVKWKVEASLLEVAKLLGELEAELGRRVDLVDYDGIHWAIRPQVISEAVPL